MKKKLFVLTLAAALMTTAAARADWTSGTESRFYTEGGASAARIALTAQQNLKTAISTADGTAEFYFQYGNTADEDAFALKLPAYIQDGTVKSALVSVTPIVDTGNGRRFYLLNTGAPGGCLLVSYSKGKYQTAFDASSVEGTYEKASIEVQKKQLILHLTDSAGKQTSHILTYDKKNNVFTAEDPLVSTETKA